MPTPEGRVKNKIKKLLNQHGVYYDMPVPYGYGKSGLDFYGCHHGRFFAIEAKAPGGQPTKLQEITIDRIQRAGGMVFVIDDDAGVTMLDAWLTLRGIG
jgi:hypothetical protein